MLIRSIWNWMECRTTHWQWEWTRTKYAYVALATFGYSSNEILSDIPPGGDGSVAFVGGLASAAGWPLYLSFKVFSWLM